MAGASGTFGAARIASASVAHYRFTGNFDVCNQDYSGCDFHFSGFAVLSMDSANNVSGTAYGLYVGRVAREVEPQRSAVRYLAQFSPARWMDAQFQGLFRALDQRSLRVVAARFDVERRCLSSPISLDRLSGGG
jgi:hypothetical protein